ncbi:MAG: Ig domain-containing protein [Bacteroidales bacterium]|nr:Ig domain-containing protein [Bacteroidales bacterium]
MTAAFALSAVFTACKKDKDDKGSDDVILVTGVTLNKETLTLGVGDTDTLIATIQPDNATIKTVSWESSNPAVATVIGNGLVTAISKGSVTIAVTTQDGSKSAGCIVTVGEVPVTGVTLNKDTLVLDIEETETLIATVLPENATIQEVYWTISNPAVATIFNGLVTPHSLGKATITVTTLDGNKTAKCDLEVTKRVPVTGVTLNKNSLNLGVGTSEQLEAIISPYSATNKNVTWSSSNLLVATVDNDGLVTAKDEGTADITVTTEDGNFTETCEVKCMNYTLPSLTTLVPTIIDIGPFQVIVKLSGNITDIGNPPYIERGFIYTIAPYDPLNPGPGPGTTTIRVSGNGIGIFEAEKEFYKDLNWNVRAYAKAVFGTTYGDIVTLSF